MYTSSFEETVKKKESLFMRSYNADRYRSFIFRKASWLKDLSVVLIPLKAVFIFKIPHTGKTNIHHSFFSSLIYLYICNPFSPLLTDIYQAPSRR